MSNERKLRVVLCKSRNKDNKDLEGFKERSVSFLSRKSDSELFGEFRAFVEDGLNGEMSRLYVSVNERDNEKIQKQLMHHLVDNDVDMGKLDTTVASIAAKKENRAENKWLFDFDDGGELLDEFLDDLRESFTDEVERHVSIRKTPNGYAVIVDKGFDTRELLNKWKSVELKRDDMLCIDWDFNLG